MSKNLFALRIASILVVSSLFCQIARASDPVSYFDGFETTLNPFWTPYEQNGTVVCPSPSQVYSGTAALLIQGTGGGQKYVWVNHDFENPQYGNVTVWVYDSMEYIYFYLLLHSQDNTDTSIGTQDWDGSDYYYGTKSGSGKSTVPRSVGWHKWEINSTVNAIVLTVDGQTIYSGPGGQPFIGIKISVSGPGYGSTSFDVFSFVVAQLPPAVVTASVSNLVTVGTNANATLNGTVNPNGATAAAWFAWGATTSYGSTTPAQSIGSGSNAVSVSTILTNLSANTVYHYCLVATNSDGQTNGLDQIIELPSLPRISSFAPGTGIVGTAVTIDGSNFSGLVSVAFNGAAATISSASSSQIIATVPAAATTGPITIITTAGTTVATNMFAVVGPPGITSFTPASGSAGTVATLNGTNLSTVTGVGLNAQAVAFSVVSDSQLAVTIGSGATSGHFSVTNAVGVATSAGVFTLSSPASDFSYYTANGAVTISGYHGMGGAVIIPGTINGLPVVTIGSEAFASLFGITSLVIPDSVTSIGMLAFSDIYGLNSVVIGNGVTNIAYEAFSGSFIPNVQLGTNIVTIGSAAFDGCFITNLSVIPASVTTISPFAFRSNRLGTFAVDPLNPNYACVDGVLFNKAQTELIQYPCGRAGNYAVPSGVTNIDACAFSESFLLTGITIPASVQTLGAYAFRTCQHLTNVIMAGGITSIGSYTFAFCTNLASIALPEGITTVSNRAFYGCGNLRNVFLPATMTNLGEEVFSQCSNLVCAEFRGDAPEVMGANVFSTATNSIVYHLAGAAGWSNSLAGRPTALFLDTPSAENFEHGGAGPAGWTQEYVTGGTSWVFQQGGNGSPKNTHPGGGGVCNALVYGSGIETRLVTPMIDCGNATAAQLTFWLDLKIYYIYQDTMTVYYKTSKTDTWKALQSYSYCSGWTQMTLDLPTPSRTYYLAFDGVGHGGYGVCLDDVAVNCTSFPLPPTLTSGTILPSGVVGLAYTRPLAASGGTGPYTWALGPGSLPPGLSLGPDGVLAGTPAQGGNHLFTVVVTGADLLSSSNQFSLAINPAPTLGNPNYSFATLAGDSAGGTADGTNTAARFRGPTGLCLDSANNLYVADTGNHTIRKITPDGIVTTLAGLAGTSGTNNGSGSAARFYNPRGLATDAFDRIYVADQYNNTIREITPDGTVTTVAGTPGLSGYDPTNDVYYFNQPAGLTFAAGGNLFIADTAHSTVMELAYPAATLWPVAGWVDGFADGTNATAEFLWPEGIVASQGAFYVADTGNQLIRKITLDTNGNSTVTTLAGSPQATGSSDGTNASARFDFPVGIAADGKGVLFVTDRGAHTVRRVSLAGVVTTLGGLAGTNGLNNDTGMGARFDSPQGIAIDTNGVIYIADTGNNRIVKGTPIWPAVVDLRLNGTNLLLNWPANYLGWELQVNTNLLGTNWITLMDSTNSTHTTIPFDRSGPPRYYRLRHQ